MPEKLELKKIYSEIYTARAEPGLVSVPELAVFAVDGEGDPRIEAAFQPRVELLYAASYALKFALKNGRGLDWTVMPTEGDWWCPTMAEWSMERRENWIWRLMIVQPAETAEEEARAALEEAARKRKGNPALASLRFERRPAHDAAHILHIGPYEAEAPTIQRLHAFIEAQGMRMTGEHREIYLGDPRKSEPSKLRTIIRQPIAR